MKEEWKDIRQYKGLYQVSNYGQVKSLNHRIKTKINNQTAIIRKGRVLKFSISRGYATVILSKNGKKKKSFIHRLVAEAFIPNRDNKPQVNHIDGNKLNNNVKNLEWATSSENIVHAFNIGLIKPPRGEKQGKSKLTEKDVVDIRNSKGIFQKDLAKKYNVSQQEISRIINNKRWGYIKT